MAKFALILTVIAVLSTVQCQLTSKIASCMQIAEIKTKTSYCEKVPTNVCPTY